MLTSKVIVIAIRLWNETCIKSRFKWGWLRKEKLECKLGGGVEAYTNLTLTKTH